jgi:hypothetical protein
MSVWQKVKVDAFCDRIIGFSNPVGDEFIVISYGSIHLITLGSKISIFTDESLYEYDVYDPETGLATYNSKKFQIIGLHGGNPILENNQGEQLNLDKTNQTLTLSKGDRVIFKIAVSNFSGDWSAVTFSDYGNFIVLDCPYDFDFVIFRRIGYD